MCPTFHLRDQQVAMRPLVDPVLESAAFLLNLRASLCHQLAFGIHRAVLEARSFEVSLHSGIRHRVCRTIDEILRNHSEKIIIKKGNVCVNDC